MIIKFRLTMDGKGTEISIIIPSAMEADELIAFNETYKEIIIAAKEVAAETGIDIAIKEFNE